MGTARLLGHCIFCGATEDLTEEHIVADWVLRAFFKSKHPPKQWSGKVVSDNKMEMSFEEPAATARVLCRPCNNGWASQIDNAAAEALKPLINGKTRLELEAQAQTAVSTWIFKSALVFDAVEHGDDGPLAGLRAGYYREKQAPPGCTIYVGPAPRTPFPATTPMVPDGLQLMMIGVRPTTAIVNLATTLKSDDGTEKTTHSTVPNPGYTVMLGRIHAILSGRVIPIIPTPEWKFACVWPAQQRPVQLVSVPADE